MDAHARILRAAREEFMVNGFRDASLRTIARESGVAVSNIYNYFEHKDSLFRAVLQPLLDEFGRIMEGHNSEHNMDVYMLMPEKFREETTKEFMQFARQFRAELKLLLLQSGGLVVGALQGSGHQQTNTIRRKLSAALQRKIPTCQHRGKPLLYPIGGRVVGQCFHRDNNK